MPHATPYERQIEMPDMLQDFLPRPASKEDPARPMQGKLRSDAYYRRDDGAFEHLLMFSVDYLEASERDPENWSDGAPSEVCARNARSLDRAPARRQDHRSQRYQCAGRTGEPWPLNRNAVRPLA
jgi:hypothetical protein